MVNKHIFHPLSLQLLFKKSFAQNNLVFPLISWKSKLQLLYVRSLGICFPNASESKVAFYVFINLKFCYIFGTLFFLLLTKLCSKIAVTKYSQHW